MGPIIVNVNKLDMLFNYQNCINPLKWNFNELKKEHPFY